MAAVIAANLLQCLFGVGHPDPRMICILCMIVLGGQHRHSSCAKGLLDKAVGVYLFADERHKQVVALHGSGINAQMLHRMILIPA